VTPPLLILAAGGRPRARKAAKFRPKEIALHMGVADLLRRLARPEMEMVAFPERGASGYSNCRKAQGNGRREGLAGFPSDIADWTTARIGAQARW
jgi:hypothetical protein